MLAYATTIHKSQGSEYPAVVIPAASAVGSTDLAWAKLRTLVEGARLASRSLWL